VCRAQYGVPHEWRTGHAIRRYGFHGTRCVAPAPCAHPCARPCSAITPHHRCAVHAHRTRRSHKYLVESAATMLDKPVGQLNAITCHLGGCLHVGALPRDHPSTSTRRGSACVCSCVVCARRQRQQHRSHQGWREHRHQHGPHAAGRVRVLSGRVRRPRRACRLSNSRSRAPAWPARSPTLNPRTRTHPRQACDGHALGRHRPRCPAAHDVHAAAERQGDGHRCVCVCVLSVLSVPFGCAYACTCVLTVPHDGATASTRTH
jgi:hypothetical protein